MDHNLDTAVASKSFQKLSEEFNYDCDTFWNKIPKACILIEDQHSIVTSTKDLIAGLFIKECCRKIISVALDLCFYAKTSPTENCFLYDKVTRFVTSVDECQSHEVPVIFRFRNWYDKWIKKSPKTGMEKEFFDFFSDPENEAAISFFGPWLATLLLRFNKLPPSGVTTLIIRFFRRENPSFWKEEFSKELALVLKDFEKVQAYLPKKNALYRAMIETSIISKDKRAYILMKSTLKSIEYNDMLLVKMIESFRFERPLLKLYQLEKATRTSRTEYSWDVYFDYLTYFHGGLCIEEQVYAKYAREFDSNVFSNLSYAKNSILCNYIAIITDYCKASEYSSATALNHISSYFKLTSSRTKVEPITNEQYIFCENAAIHLLKLELDVRKDITIDENSKKCSDTRNLSI